MTHRKNRIDDYEPELTIFDECHRLPATTFSKLVTLNTEYRIGLSASPYREDERTDHIFALTEYPVGANWKELVEMGVVNYPTVWVYLYRTNNQKQEELLDLADKKPGRGIIFCDSIEG